MCEIIKSYDYQFTKSLYRLTDPSVFVKFFKNCPKKFTVEKAKKKDKKYIVYSFGDMLKMSFEEKLDLKENGGNFLTVKYNFSKLVTVKDETSDKKKQTDEFFEIEFPLIPSYNFEQEVSNYEEKQKREGDSSSNMVNVYSIVQGNDFCPQLKVTETDFPLILQTGLYPFQRTIYLGSLIELMEKQKMKIKVLFFKDPFYPVHIVESKKDKVPLRVLLPDSEEKLKIFGTNRKEGFLYLRVTFTFQSISKIKDAKKSQIPEPLNEDEVKEKLVKFAINDVNQFKKSWGKALQYLSVYNEGDDVEKKTFMKNGGNKYLNPENFKAIQRIDKQNKRLAESDLADYKIKDRGYQENFTDEEKLITQYLINTYIAKKVKLIDDDEAIKAVVDDPKYDRYYQFQTYQRFLGQDNEFQTPIVHMKQLLNLFMGELSKNRFKIYVTPQHKFGMRKSDFEEVNDDGETEKMTHKNLTFDTKYIVRSLLDEPEQLQTDNIDFVKNEKVSLHDNIPGGKIDKQIKIVEEQSGEEEESESEKKSKKKPKKDESSEEEESESEKKSKKKPKKDESSEESESEKSVKKPAPKKPVKKDESSEEEESEKPVKKPAPKKPVKKDESSEESESEKPVKKPAPKKPVKKDESSEEEESD